MPEPYIEIERKWTYAPPVPENFRVLNRCTVERQYLSTAPEVRLTRRICPEGEQYSVTFKNDGVLRRVEVSKELSEDEYAQIRGLITQPPLILDVRNVLAPGGQRIALKHCVPLGLRFAEIEFDSLTASRSADSWRTDFPFFLEEVTDDPRYYVKNMWKVFCGLQDRAT